jgi:hypothetical protein
MPAAGDAPMQPHDTIAAGTGRAGDRGGAGGDEFVDQPQHSAIRGVGAVTDQQSGVVLDDPGEPTQAPRAGEHPSRRTGRDLGRQCRFQPRDHRGENRDRVPVLVVGALLAARSALPVHGRGELHLAAAGTALRLGSRTHRAVPVLAAALQGAQVFAALGADRRRQPRRARSAQRDEQIPDRAWCRGAPVDQHLGVVQQHLGKASSFLPAAGDADDRRRDRVTVYCRLDTRDEIDHNADRVSKHLRRHPVGHGSAVDPADPSALRTQPADTGFLAGCGALFRAAVGAATGSISSSIAQSRMSISAISTFRLSRSGRSTTRR